MDSSKNNNFQQKTKDKSGKRVETQRSFTVL